MRNNTKPADLRTDLRQYSDAELSLVVMNDEPLYKMVRRAAYRMWSNQIVIDQLDELFLYTPAQLEDFLETLDAEREENDSE